MMRLRRASVIATLSLFAWSATASAECAWVLWTNYPLLGTSQSGEWSFTAPLGPAIFDTRAECERVSLKYSKNRLKDSEDARKAGILLTPLRFHCLPDTVDPRGVKEK